MSKYYAQRDSSGRIYSIVETNAPTHETDIQVPSLDHTLLGKTWNGSSFVDTRPEIYSLNLFEFRERFTQAEKFAIYTAANSDIEIRIWLDDLMALQTSGGQVVLDDPRTIAGLEKLEQSGIIGVGRASEILTP